MSLIKIKISGEYRTITKGELEEGDKIICIKNFHSIKKGHIGTVTQVAENFAYITIDSPKIGIGVHLPYSDIRALEHFKKICKI